MNLKCPKCKEYHAFKTQGEDSNYKVVVCPRCGYSCWLKHYRAELKYQYEKQKVC